MFAEFISVEIIVLWWKTYFRIWNVYSHKRETASLVSSIDNIEILTNGPVEFFEFFSLCFLLIFRAAVEDFLVNSADFSKAAHELQACWEEIGYSRDDLKTIQDGTIDALIQPLDKVVKTSLAHEKEQLAQHRNAVAECRVRVATISAELSIPVFQVSGY